MTGHIAGMGEQKLSAVNEIVDCDFSLDLDLESEWSRESERLRSALLWFDVLETKSI